MSFLDASAGFDDDDNEEDGDFLVPGKSRTAGGLGSLFGGGGGGGSGAHARRSAAPSHDLKYQAPKQPGSEPAAVKKTPSLSPSPLAFVVDAFLYDSAAKEYRSQGKCGLAGLRHQDQEHLILYKTSQQRLAVAPLLAGHFRLDVQSTPGYACFADARRQTWSVRFHDTGDLERLCRHVALCRAAARPDDLVAQDVAPGRGETVVAQGHTCWVRYTGWLVEPAAQQLGAQFDTNVDGQRKPFEICVGAGRVIRGWEQGLVGMRETGSRFLVVPPRLGYGESEVKGRIPAKSTLAFLVQVEKIAERSASQDVTNASNVIDPEKAAVEPPPTEDPEIASRTNDKRTRLSKMVSKMGQPVMMPVSREQDVLGEHLGNKNQEAESSAGLSTNGLAQSSPSSTLVQQQQQEKQPAMQQQQQQHLSSSQQHQQQQLPSSLQHPPPSQALSDLVLAESRLQNTEMRMSIMRLDDKLERILGCVSQSNHSSSSTTNQSNQTTNEARNDEENEQRLARVVQENSDLKIKLADTEEQLSKCQSQLSSRQSELAELKQVLSETLALNATVQEEVSELREREALSKESARKMAKKALTRVFRELSSEFGQDDDVDGKDERKYSGQEVLDSVASGIRRVMEQVEAAERKVAEVAEVAEVTQNGTVAS